MESEYSEVVSMNIVAARPCVQPTSNCPSDFLPNIIADRSLMVAKKSAARSFAKRFFLRLVGVMEYSG
jgi:hypothetical protein